MIFKAKYGKIISNARARNKQAVKAPIQLLLKEKSDWGLHCLPLYLHLQYFHFKDTYDNYFR